VGKSSQKGNQWRNHRLRRRAFTWRAGNESADSMNKTFTKKKLQ
jgi:hypothetical protein